MNIKEIRRIIEKAINCFLKEQKFLTPGSPEADKFEKETFSRLRGVNPLHRYIFGGGPSGEKPQTKTTANLKHHKNENVLIVGDSTAVGIAGALPKKYTGGHVKKSFVYPSGKSAGSLTTHRIMDTVISGGRSGLILKQLERRIVPLQKILGHEGLADKLMIISLGGNDSRWYELQREGTYNISKKADHYHNAAFHDSEFTYQNIMRIAAIGKAHGYEVRIVAMRSRAAKGRVQQEHADGVNARTAGSEYQIIDGSITKDQKSDKVHATRSGSKDILDRAARPKGVEKETEQSASQEGLPTRWEKGRVGKCTMPASEVTGLSIPYDYVESSMGIPRGLWDIYREALGQRESSNKYDCPGGAKGLFDGRWQLGAGARKGAAERLKVKLPSREKLRRDPQMQEDFFAAYTKGNYSYIHTKSRKFRKASIKEKIKILAFAHLAGMGSAVIWLKGGTNKYIKHGDAFETKPITYYNMMGKALGPDDQLVV